jgi:GPH family glycoside/pentoside/hexuronide:cation symporter
VLVGYWSDRTRSRLGRRLPFILVGTPLAAIAGVLIVSPPRDSGTVWVAFFLVVTTELYSIVSTVSGGPYEALLPEIAPSSEERVRLVGMRVYFGVLGAAIGLVVAGPLVDAIGVQSMMIVMVALFLVCRYTGMLGVWNHVDREQPPAELPLREALTLTFRNRNFLAFLPTFVLFQTGLGMLTGMLPYYAKAVLEKENEGTWAAILTAVAIGAMVAAVPLFARLARRTSKSHAYGMAMLGAACAFPWLFFAGFIPGIPELVQVVVVMALIGAPLAGVYLFPATLTADIADDDANQTGMQRQATYYGTQNFVEKTAGALSPLVLSLLLMVGNTADDPLGIRLVGPVAGLFVLLGYVTFRGYRLPDHVGPVATSAD